MKIKTSDKIVQAVMRKMDERSLIGQKKYGSTMHDEVSTNKKDLKDFLIDVQEEIMDALLYIEAAKACLQEEIEECYINDKFEDVKGIELYDEEEIDARMKHVGQNGNSGLHYEDNDLEEDDTYWKSSSSHPISKYP